LKKLLDIAPYRIYPPVTGGHAAIFYPDKKLSESLDVFLFTMGLRKGESKLGIKPKIFQSNEHFHEYCYATPASVLLTFYSSARSGIPAFNLSRVLDRLKPLVLSEKIREADLIQVQFPWQFEWVYEQNAGRVPVVLVEHNIEFKVLQQKSRNFFIRQLSHRVGQLEEKAVWQADAVIVFTQEDKDSLQQAFGLPAEKVKVIPCGVDVDYFRKTGWDFPVKRLSFLWDISGVLM
jgi:glycosyltransferase involved in cell wall biosynthesis